MKKIILNAILIVITSIALIFIGINAIKEKNEALSKESSYSLTDFDYIALSPSAEQVESFKENSDATDGVFACYNFQTNVSAGSTFKMQVLMSEDMSDYDVSLFNNRTKIKGDYKEDGICLDEKAASKLGVEVGDNVKISLANKQFTLKVSSIYMTSTYVGLDSGLGLAKLTDEMKNSFTKKISYDMAFIKAKDDDLCGNMLEHYIPLGPLQSEADYIEDYKSENNKPINMTDEEWDAAIKQAYEEYKATYLANDYKNSVQVKAGFIADINDQNETTLKKSKTLSIVLGITIAIFTVISIVLPYIWKKDNEKYAKEGSQKIYKHNYLWSTVPCILLFIISFAAMLFFALSTNFVKSYFNIYAWIIFPSIISLLILIIHTAFYNSLIKNSLKKSEINGNE